jgi:hypothetical protein
MALLFHGCGDEPTIQMLYEAIQTGIPSQDVN